MATKTNLVKTHVYADPTSDGVAEILVTLQNFNDTPQFAVNLMLIGRSIARSLGMPAVSLQNLDAAIDKASVEFGEAIKAARLSTN